MSEAADRRVVLIGMMGSGKSSVGRELAASTGWALYDNDALLERMCGQTARDLVEAHGEQVLREVEAAALALGLAQPPPCIVTAAAGTILKESARAALAVESVVWLRAAPKTLFRRASGAAHRPWLSGGEEWFRASAAEREPRYASVANLVLETDQRSTPELVEEILAFIGNSSTSRDDC